MRASDKLIRFLEGWEGCRLEPYIDAAGYWTVGIGHMIGKVGQIDESRECRVITLEEAHEMLRDDLREREEQLSRAVTVPLLQNQFDALLSFLYNIGIGNFKSSTLLKRVNAREFTSVPRELMRWDKAGGRTLYGLERRRRYECVIWEMGSYLVP